MHKRLAPLALVAALLGTLFGIGSTAVDPAPAAAQSILPCPGGSNGWFAAGSSFYGTTATVNCTIQGNHIVVDLHGPNSNGGACFPQPVMCSQGVIDVWYPPDLTPSFVGSWAQGFNIEWYGTNTIWRYASNGALHGLVGFTATDAKMNELWLSNTQLVWGRTVIDWSADVIAAVTTMEGYAYNRPHGTNAGIPNGAFKTTWRALRPSQNLNSMTLNVQRTY